jgi:beta-galactosidase/beta-glucuronidase
MPFSNANGGAGSPARASTQDGTYPRPQLVREHWVDLSGTWEFEYDDLDAGLRDHWQSATHFSSSIVVPFPPESSLSGIGDRSFHRVVWYRTIITRQQLLAAGYSSANPTVLLHFGAVDYRADVWLDGDHVGSHEGGHTSFSFDVSEHLDESTSDLVLVVRAEDDPSDVTQPRGKQDWLPEPHSVWYDRTTGIWQPVWLEAVPAVAVRSLAWTTDLTRASITAEIELNHAPGTNAVVTVELVSGETHLARTTVDASRATLRVTLEIAAQTNGQAYEQLLWSPARPHLIDAVVTVSSGESLDTVASYFGMRSVRTGSGNFVINDRPIYLRAVLSQGFWPQSHLASPSADALRAEAQLIKDLGFNAARVHQKIEDPRFLYWTDRLGILVWEEMPSALEFSVKAVQRVTSEWTEAVLRDRSHPSIVAWVPLNESWGVQHIAHDPVVQAYASALFHLTHALDGTRPVISNDGWEQVETDISTIHDYEASAEIMTARYADEDARTRLFSEYGPAGRKLEVRSDREVPVEHPVMLTEFGGIRFDAGKASSAAWGYSSASSPEDFGGKLKALYAAVDASRFLAGDCYTQLTDTQQEVNGLTTEDRIAKLPIETIASIVRTEGSASG